MNFKEIFENNLKLNEEIDENLQKYVKQIETEMRLSKSRSKAEIRKGNNSLGDYYDGFSKGCKRAVDILKGKYTNR